MFAQMDFLEENETILRELLTSRSRHILLFSDPLAFDTVFEIQTPQTGHSDSFVRVFSMKHLGSHFERMSCPLLERLEAEKIINVFLVKKACFLFESERFGRLESFAADILYLVVRDLEGL